MFGDLHRIMEMLLQEERKKENTTCQFEMVVNGRKLKPCPSTLHTLLLYNIT